MAMSVSIGTGAENARGGESSDLRVGSSLSPFHFIRGRLGSFREDISSVGCTTESRGLREHRD